MTKNRALKRDTSTLAASADIRRPEAAYLASHRKLLILEGKTFLYDFSNGPLRLHGGNGMNMAMSEVKNDALRKGWRIVTITHLKQPAACVDEARKGPSLLVVNLREQFDPASLDSTIVRLVNGEHPDINVLVGLHDHDELPAGFKGGYNHRVPAGPSPFGEAPVLRPRAADEEIAHDANYQTYRNDAEHAAVENADAALDFMGIPAAAQQFAHAEEGLFLITGQKGSGKTMTGVSLLRRAYAGTNPDAAAIVSSDDRRLTAISGVRAFPYVSQDGISTLIRNTRKRGVNVLLVDGLDTPDAVVAAVEAALDGALVIATMECAAAEAEQQLMDAFPEPGSPETRAKVQSALRGITEQVVVPFQDKNGFEGSSLTSEVGTKDVGGRGSTAASGQNDRKPPVPTQRDYGTLQIAFARRYADFLSSGVDRADALGFVAEDAGGFIMPGAVELVLALRQAHQDMKAGKSGDDVWGPHRKVLGNHLVRMLVTAASTADMARLLRDAAETLEADVRIGLA